MRILWTLVVALAAGAASSAVNAVTCYTLLDGSDKLVYQNSIPPVDMGDQASRDQLRRRHEYLLISNFDTCPPVAAVAGATGYRSATVNEIVSEMRSLTYTGRGYIYGTGGGSVGGGSAASPAASPGGSGGSGSRY